MKFVLENLTQKESHNSQVHLDNVVEDEEEVQHGGGHVMDTRGEGSFYLFALGFRALRGSGNCAKVARGRFLTVVNLKSHQPSKGRSDHCIGRAILLTETSPRNSANSD